MPEYSLPAVDVIKQKLGQLGLDVSDLRVQDRISVHRRCVTFSGSYASGKPLRLFIKQHPLAGSAGMKEEFAYRQFNATGKEQITPSLKATWEDQEEDQESGFRYLVIADMTETHRCPGSPQPKVTMPELVRVIKAYATLHARTWAQTDQWGDFFVRNASLSVSHEANSEDSINACEEYFLNHCLPQRVDEWGARFADEIRQLTQRAISHWANCFRERCLNRRSLTLIHGDAHLGNVLVPIDGNAMPLFIDWEGIAPGVSAWDLVRLIYHTNFNEKRIRNLETRIIDVYFRELISHGITDYSRDDFLYDYRLSVLAYLPHTLAWGDPEGMDFAKRAIYRWGSLELSAP